MNKEEQLIAKTNKTINDLVKEKETLRRAYNYYNCIRDEEQFKYLEDNYGIGLPTQIEFIPLIRKHIDALVGEYLDTPIISKVSCKDTNTLNNIFRDKLLKIASEQIKLLQKNLKNNLLNVLGNKDLEDLNIKDQINKLRQNINENFISEYEQAGLNIVDYIIQSRNIDIVSKLKQLYIDLLVTGFTFFKVRASLSGENINIECLSPLDVFPELNYDSPYINECSKVVVRYYLTKEEILNRYGKDLSKLDIQKIKDLWENYFAYSDLNYVQSVSSSLGPTPGIRAGEEITPMFSDVNYYLNHNKIPVYEVEWLEVDKDLVTQRYSTVKIGNEIYILKGLDENAVRSLDNPKKTTLSVNGVWFNNRGKEPFSMVTTCMVLQDKYDLCHFYRDKLIANSGSVGDWVNIPTIPTFLGDAMPERIMKWLAYKKNGIGLIDTSLEGQVNTGQAPLNTMFNGFDDTVKAQAIQAILIAIDSIEATVSSITGVFRERLNGILQRDAVTNVKIGVNNSFTITKQWHFQMSLVVREILLDALNCAKIVYKNGLTGTLILGDKYLKIFTALPKHFTVTDFDIHVITFSDVIKEMEQIRNLVPDLIRGNLVPADILVEILSSKSLSQMKIIVKQALEKLRLENNLLLQLTEKVNELTNALLLSLKQLEQSQRKLENLNEAKMLLERDKIKLENEVEMFKAKTDRSYKENKAKNDTDRTKIELLLLYDRNPYNDKVVNI